MGATNDISPCPVPWLKLRAAETGGGRKSVRVPRTEVCCMSELVPGVVTLLIPYVQKAGLREGRRPVRASVRLCEVRLSEPHPS